MARNSPSEPRPSGRPGSPRARLFLALEPREDDRRALADWRDRLVEGRDDLRPSAAATLHLTLAFLGYRPEREIPAIAASAFGAVEELTRALLLPAGVAPVPRRGAPRLFALDLEDEGGRAAAIQAATEAALVRDRFHRPERRAWWPHVTLARVKRDRRAAPLVPTGAEAPVLDAPVVTLYRSTLRPQGALYEPLERIRLK
ncbi:MAG: 2,3-cyclic 3-phosphodiesterase [Thermoleophilaceae bacterium]|nr:2,3-cyclic 3-phosphodiesterase [Thermoleophilaceae bacterium]